MRIKLQYCYCGNDKFVWRALVAGGVRIPADAGRIWTRKMASEMLDSIVANSGLDRTKIRFVHV